MEASKPLLLEWVSEIPESEWLKAYLPSIGGAAGQH